jgi:hypothetical protein
MGFLRGRGREGVLLPRHIGYDGPVPAAGQPQNVPTDDLAGLIDAAGQQVDGFIQGATDAADGIIAGTVHIVLNPIQTIQALAKASPSQLLNAIVKPYQDAIATGNYGYAIGRGFVEVGVLMMGGEATAAEAADAADAATVAARAGEATDVLGDVGKAVGGLDAEAGDAGALRTMLSGEEGQAVGEISCFRAGTGVLCESGLVPIETIGLGKRVLTGAGDTYPTAIRREDYRVVRLQCARNDQEFHMAFLRPAKLFENLGPGDFIQLEVMELKLRGPARILSIEPCPEIEEGLGRVVTGAINSQSLDVRLLKLRGLDEPIHITGNHPVYCEDWLEFVIAAALRPGDRLRTREGVAVVESITAEPGRWDIFNLEVESAHQYYVSERHVLVHNGNGIFLESNLTGAGKRGLDWTEALPRAIKTGKPQGQFTSTADLDWVLEQAKTLGKGAEDTFAAPPGHTMIVTLPNGSVVPATNVFIKVYNSGKVHAIPKIDWP